MGMCPRWAYFASRRAVPAIRFGSLARSVFRWQAASRLAGLRRAEGRIRRSVGRLNQWAWTARLGPSQRLCCWNQDLNHNPAPIGKLPKVAAIRKSRTGQEPSDWVLRET